MTVHTELCCKSDTPEARLATAVALHTPLYQLLASPSRNPRHKASHGSAVTQLPLQMHAHLSLLHVRGWIARSISTPAVRTERR